MGENDDFYKKFSNSKNSPSFGLSILLPFISGMLATLLILGIAFGVPSIKEKIIGSPSEVASKEDLMPTSNIANSENLEQVSLINFSDTAIGASQKVLPSIVGISVEYNITSSSFLVPNTSQGAAQGSRNNY